MRKMHTRQIRGVITREESFRPTSKKERERNKDYRISETYNAYILPGFGAWMGNVSDPSAIHSPFYSNYREEGYELVVGPPSNSHSKYGVYCKNYQELYQSKLDAVDRLIKKDISPYSKRKASGPEFSLQDHCRSHTCIQSWKPRPARNC